MSVEWFFKLKEIDSLSRMKNQLLKAIKDQEDRLESLKDKKKASQLLSNSLQQEHTSLHQKLLETEAQIKNADTQKQRLIDMGGDQNKITSYQQQVEKLEEEGLFLLEEIESKHSELKDTQTFMEGLEKTSTEIASEVNEEKILKEKEIVNIDLRLKLLTEELPDDYRNILERVSSKKLAMGPFTRVESGSCYLCRYKLSRLEESEIDMQKSLKMCSQCGRIFLPYGA